jgi:hypothetical protein
MEIFVSDVTTNFTNRVLTGVSRSDSVPGVPDNNLLGAQTYTWQDRCGKTQLRPREVRMRKIVLSALLVLFLSFGSAEGLAQEKSYIAAEGSNLNNGVVVVDILKTGKTYVLHCNQCIPRMMIVDRTNSESTD